MPLSFRLFLPLLALLGSTPARGAAPGTAPQPLTRAERLRLDRVASRQPLETVFQEGVNLAGNAPAWLLAHLTLSPEEEARLARSWHADLARRRKVAAAPESSSRLLARLAKQLPRRLSPGAFRYTLGVVDRSDHAAFTPGGGRIYLTRPLLDRLRADRERGEAALAFLLAREVAHTALLHCRRGWQRVQIEEEIRKGLHAKLDAGLLRDALGTGVRNAGQLVLFLYSRDQEYEADAFALDLCRNAGLPVDHAIDGMRLLAALRHPDAVRSDRYRPGQSKLPSTLAYYLSPSADPLVRLRRLLMERDGLVEGEQFGLFRFDRSTGALSACGPGSVAPGERPVVFVHGMGGGKGSFRDCLLYFGERRELRSRALLVFRYPGNGSLALAGRFLLDRIRRVLRSPEEATFVCHSAGGLVFRYYAERLAGRFHRAVILGTPHAGSNLTDLKFLVDLARFSYDLTGGLANAVRRALPEGRGAIALDLQPDSLFLRHLGRSPRLAGRYHIVYGEYLSAASVLALRSTFLGTRGLLGRWVLGSLAPAAWQAPGKRFLESLRLPEEVLQGDLVVSSSSAGLPGAGRTTRLAVGHLALVSDRQAMRQVLSSLLGP
jgi:pimeloyl-ACP methyl ester carboxylesterase/Zn-dependent protease with chaperone function